MYSKRTLFTHFVTAAIAMTGACLATAQTQSDIHLDAATRNVGNDPFMTQYARAFYCNLPEDNNEIVIASRAWNNQTGTGATPSIVFP